MLDLWRAMMDKCLGKTAIFNLAQMALTGKHDDIVMFVKRLAYQYREDDREFSNRLTALLPEGSFNVLREASDEEETERSGIIEKSHDWNLRDFRTLFGREVKEGDELEILDGWAPYTTGVVTGISPHGVIRVRDGFGCEYDIYADGYDRNTDLRIVWPKRRKL